MKRKVVAIGARHSRSRAAAPPSATSLVDPEQESEAVIDDAASQLGVQPSELSDALEQALLKRVDAALAAGGSHRRRPTSSSSGSSRATTC